MSKDDEQGQGKNKSDVEGEQSSKAFGLVRELETLSEMHAANQLTEEQYKTALQHTFVGIATVKSEARLAARAYVVGVGVTLGLTSLLTVLAAVWWVSDKLETKGEALIKEWSKEVASTAKKRVQPALDGVRKDVNETIEKMATLKVRLDGTRTEQKALLAKTKELSTDVELAADTAEALEKTLREEIGGPTGRAKEFLTSLQLYKTKGGLAKQVADLTAAMNSKSMRLLGPYPEVRVTEATPDFKNRHLEPAKDRICFLTRFVGEQDSTRGHHECGVTVQSDTWVLYAKRQRGHKGDIACEARCLHFK